MKSWYVQEGLRGLSDVCGIVTLDWRGEDHRSWEGRPTRGLHGEPLARPCPEAHDEAGAYCPTCQGTGRIAPARGWDRSDIP